MAEKKKAPASRARKKSALPTRVWSFSALEPRTREELTTLGRVLRACRKYQNALVEIEHWRRREYTEIRREFSPELGAAEDEINRINDSLAELYRRVRARRGAAYCEKGEKTLSLEGAEKEEEDALKARRAAVAEGSRELREQFAARVDPGREELKRRRIEAGTQSLSPIEKARLNEATEAQILGEPWPAEFKRVLRLDSETLRRKKALRTQWGYACGSSRNAGRIEESVEQATQMARPGLPSFKRFGGGGRIVSQIASHGCVTFGELCDRLVNRFRLTKAPHDPTKSGRQEEHFLATFTFRDGASVMFPCRLHRRPPDSALVKWVWVSLRRIGTRFDGSPRLECRLQLTLEHASFSEPRREAGTRPSEHIRLGWRRTRDGIRIAHWPGGEVVLPQSLLDQGEQPRYLRGFAERYFNEAKRVVRWVVFRAGHRLTHWHLMRGEAGRAALRRVCKAYAEATLGGHLLASTWARWKRELPPGKDLFSRLRTVRRWCAGIGLGAEQAVAFWLFSWALKDHHLLTYAASAERRFQNRRSALVRSEAIRIATEFESVTIDGYSIAALKRKPDLKVRHENEQARRALQVAGPGEFRATLIQVMGPRCTKCERPAGDENEGVARKRKGEGVRELAAEGGDGEGEAAE